MSKPLEPALDRAMLDVLIRYIRADESNTQPIPDSPSDLWARGYVAGLNRAILTIEQMWDSTVIATRAINLEAQR